MKKVRQKSKAELIYRHEFLFEVFSTLAMNHYHRLCDLRGDLKGITFKKGQLIIDASRLKGKRK